jgi:hypothetical protein
VDQFELSRIISADRFLENVVCFREADGSAWIADMRAKPPVPPRRGRVPRRALAVFQRAATACRLERTPARSGHVLGQFAALKTEFGLTDRYRIEGWRAGRE